MTSDPRHCVQCGHAWDGVGDRCPKCDVGSSKTREPNHASPVDQTLDATAIESSMAGSAIRARLGSKSSESGSGISATASDGAETPMSFGDYDLLEEIARGGMGVVYKARHRQLQRLTAVKMMLGGRYSSRDAMNRFRLEAEAAASLDHHGIVPIYEIGEREGQPFFAMKFIEGGSLATHREDYIGDPERVATLIRDIARAVHHAHQRGVLHRDIKPANILIDETGQPLLTDLGLAKRTNEQEGMTRTDAVLGTPAYMSPEQALAGESVTLASDIYSLGVILFELLVGYPPHQGSSALEVLDKVRHQPAPDPRTITKDLDRDLVRICMHCLRFTPEERYPTAGALADDLDAWLRGATISLRPPTLLDATRAWVKRNRRIGVAMAALFAAFLVVAPLVLQLLGAMDAPARLYAGTDQDPVPLVFSASGVPGWVTVVAGMTILLLWPMLGAMVVVISRPATLKRAIGHGALISAVCTAFLMLTLGWVPFMLASQGSTNSVVRVLATGTFGDDPVESARVREVLMTEYPVLQEVPENQRVNYIANRIMADGIAIGPRVVGLMLLSALQLMLPTILGSAIMHTFLKRGMRWWALWPRYFFAWLSTIMTFLLWTAAYFGGRFSGKQFWELAFFQQFILVSLAPTIAFLLIRRWRRPTKATLTLN